MPLSDPQHLVDRALHRRRRLLTKLAAFNVVVAVLLAGLVYFVLHASRASIAAQTRSAADNLAAVAKLNVEAELDRIDAVLNATSDEIQRLLASGPRNDALLQTVLVSRLKILQGVQGLRLADAQGRVRWGSDLAPGAPESIADREYFERAAAQTHGRPVVYGPLQSGLSGHWVIGLARPLYLQGRFEGVLHATVDTRQFQALFDRYELGDKDAVTLRTLDTRLVARRSPGSAVQGEVGQAIVSAEMLNAVRDDPSGGSYVSKVALDGVERTTSYRAVERWPFVIYAGRNNARYLEPWRKQAWTVCGLAALSWLLVASASVLAYRSHTRTARVLASLAEQTRQTQALLRVAGDGIHILDASGQLVEMSDSFAEMLRSSRDRLLGRHVSSWDANQGRAQIDAWLAKVKVGDQQRVDVQHRRDDGSVIDVELQLRATEIGGELLVFASGRDVSEVKRLLREQTAMLESDLVGMVKVEHQTIGWLNRPFERLFGYSPGELSGQPLRMLYSDEETYRKAGEEAASLLQEKGPRRMELAMRRRTGEPIWIAVSGVRLSRTQTFWMAVDITAMKKAQEQLTHAAYHDPLTGLPNRLLMRQRLQERLAAAAREAKCLAVCYLDLDGFKAVNDRMGHEAGDLLLIEVARRIESVLRPDDIAFRIGGDEFVVVLAPSAAAEWAHLLDRLIHGVAQPVALDRQPPASVEVTVGVAISQPGGSEAETLLEQADEAMLRGKRTGKGRLWWA